MHLGGMGNGKWEVERSFDVRGKLCDGCVAGAVRLPSGFRCVTVRLA